jgi:hypothetical protein
MSPPTRHCARQSGYLRMTQRMAEHTQISETVCQDLLNKEERRRFGRTSN